MRELLFADDSALAAGSEADMQHTVNLFSSACDNFGLTIRTKKTEIMYQPAPGKPYAEPTITVNKEKLPAAYFTHLLNYPVQPTLMLKLTTGSLKPVLPLVALDARYGKETVSHLTLSSKFTEPL